MRLRQANGSQFLDGFSRIGNFLGVKYIWSRQIFRIVKATRRVCSDIEAGRPRIDTYNISSDLWRCFMHRQLRSIASATLVCHNSEPWPLAARYPLVFKAAKPRAVVTWRRTPRENNGAVWDFCEVMLLEKTGPLIISRAVTSARETTSNYACVPQNRCLIFYDECTIQLLVTISRLEPTAAMGISENAMSILLWLFVSSFYDLFLRCSILRDWWELP